MDLVWWQVLGSQYQVLHWVEWPRRQPSGPRCSLVLGHRIGGPSAGPGPFWAQFWVPRQGRKGKTISHKVFWEYPQGIFQGRHYMVLAKVWACSFPSETYLRNCLAGIPDFCPDFWSGPRGPMWPSLFPYACPRSSYSMRFHPQFCLRSLCYPQFCLWNSSVVRLITLPQFCLWNSSRQGGWAQKL